MAFTTVLILLAFALVCLVVYKHKFSRKIPVSVNYHFSRRCNKTCGFCFHTATTSHIEDLASAKKGMALLKQAGMRKINFAGGEPFLYPKFLGELIDFCKEDLHLESVSIVTNGSLVKEDFLRKHGRNIDILAVSCDSFNEATNIAIGRGAGNQVPQLYAIAAWCARHGVRFKLNHAEDMNAHVAALRPFRWKCFQVLVVDGENDSADRLRDARGFVVDDEQFDAFCRRHAAQACLVPEPNRLMARSYLILDEYMRFLDRTGRVPSQSILEVGVEEALRSVFWDETAFVERGGVYDWEKKTCGEGQKKELEW